MTESTLDNVAKTTQPTTIGVSELRTHWYAILRRAKAGETFLITRRGRPMARMVGYEPKRESDAGMARVYPAGSETDGDLEQPEVGEE